MRQFKVTSSFARRSLTGLMLMTAPLVWGATPAGNAYLVHGLVADQPGVADFTDPNLVNPWGIFTSSGSPFWVSDAGTGLSTIYTSNGTPNATTKPAVPGAKVQIGVPTGGVNNGTGGFLVQGKAAELHFVTADGTISGWASAVNATQAFIMVNNSAQGRSTTGWRSAPPPPTPLPDLRGQLRQRRH